MPLYSTLTTTGTVVVRGVPIRVCILVVRGVPIRVCVCGRSGGKSVCVCVCVCVCVYTDRMRASSRKHLGTNSLSLSLSLSHTHILVDHGGATPFHRHLPEIRKTQRLSRTPKHKFIRNSQCQKKKFSKLSAQAGSLKAALFNAKIYRYMSCLILCIFWKGFVCVS